MYWNQKPTSRSLRALSATTILFVELAACFCCLRYMWSCLKMENNTKFPVDPGTRPFKPLCIHQPDMVPFGDVPLPTIEFTS